MAFGLSIAMIYTNYENTRSRGPGELGFGSWFQWFVRLSCSLGDLFGYNPDGSILAFALLH